MPRPGRAGPTVKRLSGWDAALLYSEAPNVHMHTLKIAVIDPAGRDFRIEDFRTLLASRLSKLDPARYQLVDIPFKLHHPMWREHCDVDLDDHIRPLRLPSPGGRRELDEAIGALAGVPLDRRRPLWQTYFIEGLADNRIAIVAKVHHALADGVASANLIARAMDAQSGVESDQDCASDPAPTKGQLVRSALRDHLRQARRIPATVKYTAQGLARVRSSPQKLSPTKVTRPFTPPPSFMNHVLTSERRFATATLSLSDVKATSKHLGVTLNDMLLGISAGALRTLSLRYDGRADHALLASVPISFDLSPDRLSGNLFSGVMVALPIDVADPLERIRRTHAAAESAKEGHRLIGPELISMWANYLPPALAEWGFRRMAVQDGQNKLLNLPISNVPGPRKHGHVG